jgi:hypothetical protein
VAARSSQYTLRVTIFVHAPAPVVAQRPRSSVVWTDPMSQAGANTGPLVRNLVLMAATDVITATD